MSAQAQRYVSSLASFDALGDLRRFSTEWGTQEAALDAVVFVDGYAAPMRLHRDVRWTGERAFEVGIRLDTSVWVPRGDHVATTWRRGPCILARPPTSTKKKEDQDQ